MSDPYRQLLDATVQYLEQLKSSGVRHVSVSPETLASLWRSNPSPAAPAPLTRAQPAVSATAPRPVANSFLTRPIAPAIAPVPAAAKPMTSADPAKVVAFEALRQRVVVCVQCPHLASSRTQTVFGVGNLDADLMFVGEAPGADEDAQGEPFVGKAGQLLTKIIQATGLSRDSVYIANILKCRPDTPGQAYGNRKPTSEEMQTCLPYLREQIELVKPKALVALGATAVEGLLGKTDGIMKLRGNWREFQGIPLMPTFHPAYLLRNQAMTEKRKVWEDMLAVMEKLNLPISEKQRNFFKG